MRRREVVALLSAAMVAPPLGVPAQQTGSVSRLGYLTTGALDSAEVRKAIDVLRLALRELGYIEGQNIIIEYRGAGNQIERLPELARELASLKFDVIFAGATPAGLAAQQATRTIPIVVSAMGDPIGDGLVASLAKPGGNLTGTTFLGPELVPKRFALLRELLPHVSRIAVLRHPGAFTAHTMNEMHKEATHAANTLRMRLEFVDAKDPGEFERAFGIMAEARCEALFQFPSTMLFGNRRQVVELAATHRLPAMYNAREFIELGGLISYGANLVELTRRSAIYAAKIIRGAKPSELPVEQPTKFELVVNLKTAKSLGLTVPASLLARADEVIE